MSHFTEIKTQIKDIEALPLAVQEMGVVGQKIKKPEYHQHSTRTNQP